MRSVALLALLASIAPVQSDEVSGRVEDAARFSKAPSAMDSSRDFWSQPGWDLTFEPVGLQRCPNGDCDPKKRVWGVCE
jgi:hypothetical protein